MHSELKRYIIYKNKIPCSPITGCAINITDKGHWLTYTECLDAVKQWRADGIGFVIAPPYWFLDIDHCLVDDKWSELAARLLVLFRGAAVEVSQSGCGLHLFGRGEVPSHACKNNELGIEFYTENRYAALTGTHASGSMEFDATNILPTFIAEYFPPSIPHPTSILIKRESSLPDEELLALALNSRSNPFKRGATFKDLWEAKEAALNKAYPPISDRKDGLSYDASSADAALAQHLAFWSGNDIVQMERLMMASQLMRDKWTSRADYLPRTLEQACAKQTAWYEPAETPIIERLIEPASAMIAGAPIPTQGSRLLSIADQIELFKGCVYVRDDHKALVPGGDIINADRFRVIYGGYSFVMDKENNRISRNAWEAFTENQGFKSPRVINTCFRPLLPPAAIINENDSLLVNTWWPIHTPRRKGDASPFVAHVAKLLPDPDERARVLAYLAALVQHQGVKFEWCLVLQGVEGNGKTLITRCLARAIGNRYTHFPKADQIAAKFNDWMENRILIAVEDISDTSDIVEAFKRLITHERQEIEPKGGKKVTRDICCNFIINTNHRGALKKSQDDRRLGIFYTAQQDKIDLERDGMNAQYFQSLYNWLNKEGYEIVTDFLFTYIIPDEYNPALKHIAPVTRSTALAIEEGMTVIEEVIREAIGEELSGFKGGWISSIALSRLLIDRKLDQKITNAKRRVLLKSMGYVPHPALKDGRTDNAVLPDGGKPRLFLQIGNPAMQIEDVRAVGRAYSDAQNLS